MILDNTKILEVKLAGAHTVTAPHVSCDWVELTAAGALNAIGNTTIATNGATAVTACAAPTSTNMRKINRLSVSNVDTVACVVTVRNNVSSVYAPHFADVTLQPSETLEFTDSGGLKVIDAQGNIKNASAGGAGRFIRTTVLTSGTTHKVSGNCTSIFLRGVGGGGGGGGASYAASNQAFGAGGGSGGYLEKTVAVVPNTTYSYTIGALGGGGANTGATGTGGGAGTFVVGGTTYTAQGGSGGVGMVTGATLIFAPGGAGGAVSTNGDLNGAGQPGTDGQRHSGVLGCSGTGGSTAFGRGGAGAIANGVGIAGIGYGAGGGGATAVSAAQVGGAGTAGCWIVDEYT